MTVAQLDIRLLGRFSVRRAGREIPPAEFHGRLVRTLLRLLVTRRGELVTRDYLTESLWPGRPPADPERNLNVMIARARRALGEPSLIVTGTGGYFFQPTPGCTVDAEIFLSRVRSGREALTEGRHGEALEDFTEALDLWAGEPVPEDAYEDWARDYRRRLNEAYLQALEGAAAAALEAGLFEEAVRLARTAAAREPLREAAHLLLTRCLTAAGDTAAALSVLRDFRLRLAEELGLDPPSAVSDLEKVLLRGGAAIFTPTLGHSATPPVLDEMPFIGREPELAAVVDSLRGLRRGTVVVSGPGGSGKTRLIREACRRLDRPVLYGRAFSAEREEAWSLTRTLVQEALALFPDSLDLLPPRIHRALCQIVPQVQAEPPHASGPIDPQSTRSLALQGAIRVLEEVVLRGAALVVDDLQWCDPTTASMLAQASVRIGPMPMVLAHRSSQLDQPVAAWVNDQLEHAVASVELGSLGPEAVAQLFVEPELAHAVSAETDRTPMALAELIRSTTANGLLEARPGNRWSASSPDAVEQVRHAARGGRLRSIAARAQSLSSESQQVLKLLALLGHPATARLLAKAGATDEGAVLDGLESLARVNLVRLTDDGWVPSHDLVGEAVSARLGQEEKGRLHALLAKALEHEPADRAQVARHLAGAGDRVAAARTFAGAGKAALDRFASQEAEEMANSGLVLSAHPAVSAELLEIRAEARSRRGQIPEAREDLHAALAAKQNGPDRSLVLSRLALLISGAEDYSRASELADLALTEAGSDLPARARALAVAAMVEGNLGNLERSGLLAEQALDLFRKLENAHGTADILELKGLNLLYAGRITDAVDVLGRVATLFRDSGKLLRIGPAVSMRCLGLRAMARAAQGLGEIEEVLELELQLGNLEGESWCRSTRALLLAEVGRSAEAEAEGRTALELARRMGHRELVSAALLSLGAVLEKAQRLDEALTMLEECAAEAAGLPAFRCFAASGMALIEVEQGKLASAEVHLQQARDAGFPFALYQADVAHAKLLIARKEPGAQQAIAGYLKSAESGGDRLTVERLRQLLAGARPITVR